jgi:eukaryotic-like serine/threonine-protein kinase
MADETAKLMGDYEILGVLGAGGMGRVYRVRNVITDRIEAMKVLLPDLEGQEEVAARFLREIKLLAALNHPNIASLHTALTINNQLVMIMEYVEGQTLASRLAMGPIAVPDALTYIDQGLSALSYAHQQHVIHRDIKPANMMLTPEGVVKLMDFGIARTDQEPAKLTAPGTTLGSINYMSPEQVKGGPIDERSDLYSMGISLYEMVTGQKPFQGDSNFSIMAAQIQQAPTPPVQLNPALPAALNEIILTSIAKSADDRFQSADAFRNAISSVSKTLQDAKTVVVSPTAVTASGAVAAAYMKPLQPTPVPTRASTTAAPAVAPTSARISDYSITPQARPTSNRGLYMALGALVVVAVLVAAGIYLPGRGKNSVSAGSSATPAVTQPQPAPTPAPPTQTTTPAPTTAPETAPSPAPAAVAPTQTPHKKVLANSSVDGGAASASAAAAAAEREQAADQAKQLDEVEHQIDQLTARAGGVSSSLDNLKRQQAASGYGLRGDMAEHESSMKLNLSKAQNAIEHNDLERAKRYAGMAEADVEALEKFLGR